MVKSNQNEMTTAAIWPTLAGRLRHPLSSRVEAIQQLEITMPISPLAQAVLKQSKRASSNGLKRKGSSAE